MFSESWKANCSKAVRWMAYGAVPLLILYLLFDNGSLFQTAADPEVAAVRSAEPAPTVLRTPDSQFAHLPGYPFSPHYAQVGDSDELWMHYVDEGPADGSVILMLHGNPSWSYLYRWMIPPLAKAGYRVIAPDLIGFGKSDKPTQKEIYSYAGHVLWMRRFVERSGFTNVTLFCQDWGGLIGLRLITQISERFDRVAACNTALPEGEPQTEGFMWWLQFSQTTDDFAIGHIVSTGMKRNITKEEIAAYDAPFPDDSYKVAPKVFPLLWPITPDDVGAVDNRKAWALLEKWEKPFVTLFSDGDRITRGAGEAFQQRIPGCKGQPHSFGHGGHFLQEDNGLELAQRLIDWIPNARSPVDA